MFIVKQVVSRGLFGDKVLVEAIHRCLAGPTQIRLGSPWRA